MSRWKKGELSLIAGSLALFVATGPSAGPWGFAALIAVSALNFALYLKPLDEG